MNSKLRSQLIQTLALADKAGLDVATEFLLDQIHPTQEVTNTVFTGEITEETIKAVVREVMSVNRGLVSNRKIEGIRAYRILTGERLKEAKDWIEKEFEKEFFSC